MPFLFNRILRGQPNWGDEINQNFEKLETYTTEMETNSATAVDVKIKGKTRKNLFGIKGQWSSQMITNVYSGTLEYNKGFVLTAGETGRCDIILPLKKQCGDKLILLCDIIDDRTHGELYFGYNNNDAKYHDDRSCFIYHEDRGQKASTKILYRIYEIEEEHLEMQYTSFIINNRIPGEKVVIDNLRCYKITDEEFDALLTMTPEEVAAEYEYVDGLKGVMNPYIESIENYMADPIMILGAADETGQLHENNVSEGIISSLVTTEPVVHVKPGDTFTVSIETEKYDLSKYEYRLYNCIGNGWEENSKHFYSADTSHTFEFTEEGDVVFQIGPKLKNVDNTLLNKVMEMNICMVRGNSVKKYSDCVNSRISFETTLYDGEEIEKAADGSYVKKSLYDELVLDENLSYEVGPTVYDGYKDILVKGIPNIDQITESTLIMYDGYELSGSYVDQANECFVMKKVPNQLTGWGNAYTPSPEEVKAFILGWKIAWAKDEGNMNYSGMWNEYYNDPTSSAIKTWAKLFSGTGTIAWDEEGNLYKNPYIVRSSAIMSLPTYKNDQGYFSPVIIYKKKDTTRDVVKRYGELLVNSSSDIYVSSGLVLSEKVSNRIHGSSGKYEDTYFIGADESMPLYRIGLVKKAISENNERKIIINDSRYINPTYIKHIHYAGLYCARILNPDDSKFNFVDYLVYKPDTVVNFDVELSERGDIKDRLQQNSRSYMSIQKELEMTKKKLEYAEYELSQRSNPNLLINGDFQVWQRGTEFQFEEDKKYCADRWRIFRINCKQTCLKTENGILFKTGEALDKTNLDVSSSILQIIENSDALLGKTVTVSIKVKKVIASIVKVRLDWNDGNSHPIDKRHFNNNGIVSFVFNIPKNKYSEASYLNLVIDLVGENSEIEIEWIKLEVGEFPTPFVPKSYTQELLDCQRYFVRLKPITHLCTLSNNTGALWGNIIMPVSMRVHPKIEESIPGNTLYYTDIESNTANRRFNLRLDYQGTDRHPDTRILSIAIGHNDTVVHDLSFTTLLCIDHGYLDFDAEIY